MHIFRKLKIKHEIFNFFDQNRTFIEQKKFIILQKCLRSKCCQNTNYFCSSFSRQLLKRYCTAANLNRLGQNYDLESQFNIFKNGIVLDDLESSDLSKISDKFGLKGLDLQFLRKYNIKVAADLNTLLLPLDSIEKEFKALHLMSYKSDVVGTRLEADYLPKAKNLLFGLSLTGLNHKEIIITSQPLDAVAVHQETDVAAISLPCDFQIFSQELLNILKTFARVTFWLKPELHDWNIHKTIGSHLGKCAYFIRPDEFSSALTCLQNGYNLKDILKESYPVYDEDLETFDSYVDIIHEELRGHERNSGIKWKRFSVLNDILKGHRRGELTIFSGQTGTGKTTFMSEYSLDLCMQGLPTLWASFEIANTKLIKTMLSQFSECSLAENIIAYDYWSEQFRRIPMFFLTFHGPRTLKRILQAMKNAVIVYKVQHIVLDNLQFLMNMEDYNSTIDHFRRQDQIFGAFRDFATRWNCHLTLVIHPRKEPEFSELNNSSISGTAKATQEADNILILQTTKTRQYLQVTKNRFDGHKGCVIVEFNKKNQMFNVKKMSPKSKDQENSTIL